MMRVVSEIWRELRQPSAGAGWYEWALMAFGHVMLGAFLVELLCDLAPHAGAWRASALVVVGYVLVKEVGDLGRAGRLWDCVLDAVFVGVGTLAPAEGWTYLAWALVAFGVVWRILWGARG